MSYIGNEPVVSATRTITEVVASGGQTVFYPNGGYTVGYLDVAVNGSLLQASDFVATNGTSVTLNVACGSGDEVKLIAWGTFTTSSSYTQAQADTLLAAKQPLNSNLTAIAASGYSMMKNRIINGAMMIDQRNAGASVFNAFVVDRFYGSRASATATYARSTVAPTGFTNSLGLTVTTGASTASGDTSSIQQGIEGFNVADLGWGTANAQTVTLSFWVRSSVTGNYGASFRNGSGNRSYVASYTVNAANTWEYKTLTIAGDTSGTWATDNTAGIYLNFDMGVGSTYSTTSGSWQAGNFFGLTGGTKIQATTGATFYITGVQLERGSTATSFDYRPYGTELALCQRYYQTFLVDHRYYPSSTSGYWSFTYSFNVNMRTTPVTTQSGGAVLNMVGGGFQDITALGSNSMRLQSNPIAANSDTYALSRVITASAEL